MSRQEDFKKAADDYVEGEPDGAQKIVGQVGFEFGAEYGYQYAQTHPNWISVENELPKEGQVVLINTKGGSVSTACYTDGRFDITELFQAINVTHWMPIVPPRKETNNE